MNLESQALFFFSALGAFNGLLLGIYFCVFSRPKKVSNYFLGGLLLAISLRVGKSVFYFFNRDLSKVYLQIGLSACFLIGPMLYFYLLHELKEDKVKSRNSWVYHFVVLGVFIAMAAIFFPYTTHHELWVRHLIPIIYYQWVIYIIVAGFSVKKQFAQLVTKQKKLTQQAIWVLSIYIGNAIIWIAYNTVAYTSYIAGALSFSFIFYLCVLLLLFQRTKKQETKKYANKKIAQTEAQELLMQLEQLMEQEALFKNPNLKLNDVAKALNILPHRLSQLLNDNLGKSFTSYINELRVAAAKKLLKTDHPFTLEALGYECGFSSQSNFYASFRKITGTTPAKYKKALQ
ncbi:MAG: helix-turn-helix domain-containing protein [Flammeovirgaceae bacterium]